MRHLPIKSLAGSALLLLGLTASAQVYRPDRGDDGYRYRDRDDYRYRDRDDYRGGGLFDRVRSDLDRAEAGSYPNGGDRRRFNKVREELGEFQRKGNKRELDDTIGALQKVVNDNRLSYRDRQVLSDDLYRMRDFRARQGYRR